MVPPPQAAEPDQLAFGHVGILYHPKLAESRVMAAEMLEFIENLGASAWVSSSWSETDIKDHLQDLDLLITLGGDGSMLRAARLTAGRRIPILGVNMGRLGFLTEVEPAQWPQHLRQALLGQYWIEERMMLHAEHRREGRIINAYEALNEIVVSRGKLARVVRLHTYIDEGFLTTYTADGIIIATATGSTAYALAAGGPILPPELENFLLIPLAPHLSLERAIVLSKGACVCVQVSTDHTAVLTIDGQSEIEVTDGDEAIMSAGPSVGRFVRLQERNYFYRTLMQRLGWPQSRK
ncbi:MAG: NAD(+)/NADH kinase [Anaerolineae bacterium]|nr:NAD(+)/NADH kinase [Anaerolineae bacterium]